MLCIIYRSSFGPVCVHAAHIHDDPSFTLMAINQTSLLTRTTIPIPLTSLPSNPSTSPTPLAPLQMASQAITLAIAESSTAEWLSILVFIFGGCCSNVWALEAVLKEYPGSGTFLTFSQIVYVAFGNLAGNVWVPALHRPSVEGAAGGRGRVQAGKEIVGEGEGEGDEQGDGAGRAVKVDGRMSAETATGVSDAGKGAHVAAGGRAGKARVRWYDWIPRLRARKVPLWRWSVQVVLFLGVSLCE